MCYRLFVTPCRIGSIGMQVIQQRPTWCRRGIFHGNICCLGRCTRLGTSKRRHFLFDSRLGRSTLTFGTGGRSAIGTGGRSTLRGDSAGRGLGDLGVMSYVDAYF